MGRIRRSESSRGDEDEDRGVCPYVHSKIEFQMLTLYTK